MFALLCTKVPHSEMNLKRIKLKSYCGGLISVWSTKDYQKRFKQVLRECIELIGKLDTRLDLVCNFFNQIDTEAGPINMGNIGGLFGTDHRSMSSENTFIQFVLPGSQITRIGSFEDGMYKYPADRYAIARRIRETPTNKTLPTTYWHQDLATAIRKQCDLVWAYDCACCAWGIIAKRNNFPRDVMRLVTRMFSPQDWDNVRGLTVKNPGWVAKVIRSHKVYTDASIEHIRTVNSIQNLQHQLKEAQDLVKSLPGQIQKKKKEEETKKREVDQAQKELLQLCEALETDSYGRPVAPKKKRVKKSE